MQSSAGVVFRALTMLAFLIGLPIVALSGTSWPETLRRLQEKWQDIGTSASSTFTSLTSFASSSPLQPLSEAPQFEPAKAGLGPDDDARQAEPLVAIQPPTPGQSTSAARAEHATLGIPGNPAETGVVPASFQTAVGGAVPDQTASAAASADRIGTPGGRDSHAAESLSGRSPAAADRFAYIQNQLRRLGATYYLLESWGDEQPLYRFYCKMAMGGNAGYTRYFEATDANPLQAMSHVLREVEAWRNGKNLESGAPAPVAK